MRTKLIAGNWKMHGLKKQGDSFANQIKDLFETSPLPDGRELLICPPFTLLHSLQSALQHLRVKCGGQNCHTEEEGAFTGEISASMLKDSGCDYVILGHSERRQYFQESNSTIEEKAKTAIKAGLAPIICIGETLQKREGGETQSVLEEQIHEGVPEEGEFLLAYEPVWAIGTGKNADPKEVVETHAFIREAVLEVRPDMAGSSLRILYGGSVKPENAASYLTSELVDGALVGGASLDAKSFWKIAQS